MVGVDWAVGLDSEVGWRILVLERVAVRTALLAPHIAWVVALAIPVCCCFPTFPVALDLS